jgi:hypothetical protein
MREKEHESVFGSLPFGESQARLASLAKRDAESLLDRANYVAPGRYRSLFQTNLETAMMFLNKAIAFDGITEMPVQNSAPIGAGTAASDEERDSG